MSKPYNLQYSCLNCGHNGVIQYENKSQYKETCICPECNGPFVDLWAIGKYKRQSDEISIVMETPNKPPRITLNGKEIKGIVELRYAYDTSGNTYGQHNFTVKYYDEETNIIRTVAVNKVWEDEVNEIK